MISTVSCDEKEANCLNDVSTKYNHSSEEVDLLSLSEMTGFPADFIKQELMLKGDQVLINELRKAVLEYLDSEFFKQ